MILRIIIGLSKLSPSNRLKGQLLIIIKIFKIIIRLKGQLQQGGSTGDKKPVLVVLEEIPASFLSQVTFTH